jgi:hypothetical protein
MNAPVWFLVILAAFVTGRSLRLLWDWYVDIHTARVQRTIDALDKPDNRAQPSEYL